MSWCGSNGRSEAVSLGALVDLPVSNARYQGKGCTPYGVSGEYYARLRGFTFPENGEFAWGGNGFACNMCSEPNGGYGCDSCVNGFGLAAPDIAATRPTVMRLSYRGDPSACCLGNGMKTQGSYTCDPQYRGGAQSGEIGRAHV